MTGETLAQHPDSFQPFSCSTVGAHAESVRRLRIRDASVGVDRIK